MSTDKAMVTDEMVKAVAWSASSQPGQPFGMILTDDDIRNILTIGMANGPTALSHGAEAVEPDACPTCGGTGKEGRHSICRDCDEGAEAVEPEQKPVGEVCDMPGTRGFTMAAFKVEDVPVGTKLYASPVRSAQEAVKVKPLVWEGDGHWCNGDNEGWMEEANTPFGWGYSIEFGRHNEGTWIVDTTFGVRLTGFESPDEAKAAAQADYEQRILSALLPPGGETATRDTPAPVSNVRGITSLVPVAEVKAGSEVGCLMGLTEDTTLYALRKDGFAAGFEAQQAGADEDTNPYEEGSDQWRDWNEGWESANSEEPEDTQPPQQNLRVTDLHVEAAKLALVKHSVLMPTDAAIRDMLAAAASLNVSRTTTEGSDNG